MPPPVASPHATEVKKPLAPNTQISCIRFSPCGKILAAAGHDGTIRRFNATEADPTELPQLAGHNGWVTCLAFHPNRKWMFSSDSWGRLIAWDTTPAEPKPLWNLESAHEGWLRKLAISPDGKTLATCGRDGFIRLWNPDNGTKLKEWNAKDDTLALAFHPNGTLISGDLHGRTQIWDLGKGTITRTIEVKDFFLYERIQEVGGVRCYAFDGEGKTLFIGGAQPKSGGFVQATPHLYAFEWESGKQLSLWKGTTDAEGYIHDLRWNPAGFVMAVTSGQPGQGKLLFWKPGEAKPHFEASKPNCHSLDLQPDGLRVAVSATNANSSGNGRVKSKDGYYPANTSPIHLWILPKVG